MSYRGDMQRDLLIISAMLGLIIIALLKLILVCTCFRPLPKEELEEETVEVREDENI